MDALLTLAGALFGTLVSSVLGILPALHVYNVAGLIIMGALGLQHAGIVLPETFLVGSMVGLVVGYSIVGTVPAVFLGAPDESAIFITLPGQKYLMLGKGFEAALLTGVGSLGAIALLALISPVAPTLFRIARVLFSPHLFWILGVVLLFLVMSEWPKGGDRGRTGFARFSDAWRNLVAGLATLTLSGLMGCIIIYRPVVPIEVSFQNLMPALVGLFAVPWVITNVISRSEVPKQHIPTSINLKPSLFIRGTAAGAAGGLFAAFFPIVTGGMGGLFAGHATAQRDERLFIVSQGASKVCYYVGAFLLLFMPGLNLTRGGMAWMISSIVRPYSWQDYLLVVGAMLISGALAFLLLILASRVTIWVVERINYRLISIFTLGIILVVVYGITGGMGLLVMTVGTGIGLIPVMFHSRRMNCMGVLLIPVILNMAGLGPTVAALLGLD